MKKRWFIALFVGLLAGCGGQAAGRPTAPPVPNPPTALPAALPDATATAVLPQPVVTTAALPSPAEMTTTAVPASPPIFSFTYQQPDGNRVSAGVGRLPRSLPLDIPLDGQPEWVLAAPIGDGVVWSVMLADGRVQGFQVNGAGEATAVNLPDPGLAGFAPIMRLTGDEISLLRAPTSPAAGSHPVIFNQRGDMAYGTADGRLVLSDANGLSLADVAVNPLPDARILYDENGRLLLLTDPADRYGHGVLGDGLEAGGVTLVETAPESRVALSIPIPEPGVVEGISPIWTDWDGDGRREIIVTQSDANQGAQVVVYDESGTEVAAGPVIGQGFRWRHQIAVAPFGPNGEMELAESLTPHIGGVVGFYRWEGDALRIVAQLPGYTSHVIYSRNMDMAAAADFDGDGRYELLLPNQQRTELGGIRRTPSGAEAAWTLPLDGVMVTNLGMATGTDGRLWLGVGLADGTLRLWLP